MLVRLCYRGDILEDYIIMERKNKSEMLKPSVGDKTGRVGGGNKRLDINVPNTTSVSTVMICGSEVNVMPTIVEADSIISEITRDSSSGFEADIELSLSISDSDNSSFTMDGVFDLKKFSLPPRSKIQDATNIIEDTDDSDTSILFLRTRSKKPGPAKNKTSAKDSTEAGNPMSYETSSYLDSSDDQSIICSKKNCMKCMKCFGKIRQGSQNISELTTAGLPSSEPIKIIFQKDATVFNEPHDEESDCSCSIHVEEQNESSTRDEQFIKRRRDTVLFVTSLVQYIHCSENYVEHPPSNTVSDTSLQNVSLPSTSSFVWKSEEEQDKEQSSTTSPIYSELLPEKLKLNRTTGELEIGRDSIEQHEEIEILQSCTPSSKSTHSQFELEQHLEQKFHAACNSLKKNCPDYFSKLADMHQIQDVVNNLNSTEYFREKIDDKTAKAIIDANERRLSHLSCLVDIFKTFDDDE